MISRSVRIQLELNFIILSLVFTQEDDEDNSLCSWRFAEINVLAEDRIIILYSSGSQNFQTHGPLGTFLFVWLTTTNCSRQNFLFFPPNILFAYFHFTRPFLMFHAPIYLLYNDLNLKFTSCAKFLDDRFLDLARENFLFTF